MKEATGSVSRTPLAFPFGMTVEKAWLEKV